MDYSTVSVATAFIVFGAAVCYICALCRHMSAFKDRREMEQQSQKLCNRIRELAKQGKQSGPLTVFCCSRVPGVTLERYLDRIGKHMCPYKEETELAMNYLSRVSKLVCITPHNEHLLVLTAYTLALKLNRDRPLANAWVARLGGIQLGHMNRIEIRMLELLDNRLFVSQIYRQHAVAES